MAHSAAFVSAKFGNFHSPFTNDYLLKHGNFFMKPTIHPDGFVYPALSEAARYQVYKNVKCESQDPDMPLNFAIKEEKPPTPPASMSPSPEMSPSPGDTRTSPQIVNGQSKNATWILGKQKLSWDNSTVASYNPETKMFRCVVCNAVGFLSRIAEHYLGTHTSAKVFQCLHCPYSSTWSRCVRMHMAKHHGVPNAPPSLWKGQPLLEEIFQLLTNLKTTVDSQGRERLDPELCDKKFVCPKCPYTTDRRDLYLRHENIHKEDKPYHCYICFKLFNRADHVKKHFLRIHRGHPYDISLVRRRPPRVSCSSNGTNTTSNGIASIPNQTTMNAANNFSVDKILSPTSGAKSPDEVVDLSNRDVPASDSELPNSATVKQLKTFQCPYCPWEGVDSWCLRRHMNVHLKSFECPVCDFKAGKAERLFTHVYRSHKKLVCTKCKFVTELAQDFEVHIKECCLEIIVGNLFDKTSEESHESDDASPEIKPPLSSFPPELPLPPFALPDNKLLDRPLAMDMKGSVSLMPLHNSISYCYPASQSFTPEVMNPLNGFGDSDVMLNVNGDSKSSTHFVPSTSKIDIKSELASPVQSSSDSGVADITSDNNDHDITCLHCGCEFANLSSLQTHTELYHREDLNDSKGKRSSTEQSVVKTKKFCCAICNFNSDKQRTIIEHMRFHTGEVLPCRAGPPCAFTTVCDSTLEKHVEQEHNDCLKRCPHCGLPCGDRVSFIRHYRKCHHSKSCSRCREIKHELDDKRKINRYQDLPPLLSSGEDSDVVRPYLHHNPYSKRLNANAITPYAHCNAAMSKVAVAIPQVLQSTVVDNIIPTTQSGGHKPRKQPKPRKLLHSIPVQNTETQSEGRICDTGSSGPQKTTKPPLLRMRKFKPQKLPSKSCRLGHLQPLYFRYNVDFVRHLFWSHVPKKYRCFKCNRKFKYQYQVLIHHRKIHEPIVFKCAS